MILFISVSCEKQDIESHLVTSNTENVKLYNSLVMLSQEQQKTVMTAFSPTERYEMWMIKLDDFMSSNNLNSEQYNLIMQLQKELHPDLLTDRDIKSARKTAFISDRKNFYWNKAIELFGEDDGEFLLTHTENINHAIRKLSNKNSKVTRGIRC